MNVFSLEYLPAAAVLTDHGGTVVSINSRAAALLNTSTLLGKHVSALSPGIIPVIHAGIGTCEFTIPGKGQITAEIETSSMPLHGETHFLSIIREVPKFYYCAASFFEHSRDGVVVINLNHQVKTANSRFCSMIGYSEEELKSLHTWDYDLLATEDDIKREFSAEKFSETVIESKHRRKDGSCYDVEVSITPIRIHDEPVYLCICRDITEKKTAELALMESARTMRETLERIQDAFTSFDSSWHYVYVNQRAAEILGTPAEELIGNKIWDLFPELADTEIGGLMLQAAYEKRHIQAEKYDEILKVWLNVNIYYSENGISVFFQDISLQVNQRMKEEMQHAFQQVIAETSFDFLSADESTFAEKTDRMLQQFGELLKVERSYVLLASDNFEYFTMTNEWCSPGTASVFDLYRRTLPEKYRYIVSLMDTGDEIAFSSIEDLPPEAEDEKQLLLEENIKSILLLPIRIEGRILGMLGFDAVTRHKDWDPSQVSLLKVAANLLAEALTKLDIEKRLVTESRRLNSIIDGTKVGIWEHNLETKELTVNETWAAMLGYSIQELSPVTMDTWRRLTHPEDARMVKKLSDKLEARELEFFECEIRMRHKDGRWIWVYARGSIPEWTIEGTPRIFSGTHQDISQRKHYEEMMRYIIEHTRSAIAVHDRDLNYIFVSQRYLDEFGIQENIIGRHHYEVFPDLPKKWRDVHRRCLAGEVISRDDDHFQRSDGTLEWTSWECRPWFTSEGEIGGIIVYTEVITQRKQAEQQHERLQEQLAQTSKMESVGRLAGGVAHDFNNMLQAIIGHAELALEEALPESSLRSSLEMILQAAEKSANLTRQLLAYARKQAVRPQILNMNHAVVSMTTMLKRLIGEEIELILHLEQSLWNTWIDPAQLDQVLINLCLNARDAIKNHGEIIISTSNRISENGKMTELCIRDTGAGMNQDVLDKAFEPFFTTKRLGEGTGLGLSMVYGIAAQNGGEVFIKSAPSQGTTVTVLLPRSADSSEEPVSDQPHGRIYHPGIIAALVVEDDQNILTLVKTILKKMGHHVYTAASPKEALELAKTIQLKLDLLITDVVMPGMNGYEFSREIASLYNDISILFMSGYTADVLPHQEVLHEKLHFIQKPFTAAELDKKIQEVLYR